MFYQFTVGPEGTPRITLNPEIGQYEGEPVTFNCDGFQHGNPRSYTYTWKRNGVIKTDVDDNTKKTLEFFMTSEDEGNYTCMAENEYGPPTAESAAVELLLIVGIPPPGM